MRLQRTDTRPWARPGGRWQGDSLKAVVMSLRPPLRQNLATFLSSTRGVSAMSPVTSRKTERLVASAWLRSSNLNLACLAAR